MQTQIKPWTREDLFRTLVAMLKIAGWAFAIAWAAYAFRFSSLLRPVQSFFLGSETPEQIASAQAAWGQLGDFVGGTLNPLVSMLGLAGLAFTLLLQHEAMTQVRKDSAATQSALAMQTHLSLQTARLQSLTAALDVVTELHRQALAANHASSFDLLRQKESLAGQILKVNEELDQRFSSESAEEHDAEEEGAA
jgi:hypothetical protein